MKVRSVVAIHYSLLQPVRNAVGTELLLNQELLQSLLVYRLPIDLEALFLHCCLREETSRYKWAEVGANFVSLLLGRVRSNPCHNLQNIVMLLQKFVSSYGSDIADPAGIIATAENTEIDELFHRQFAIEKQLLQRYLLDLF